MWILFDDAREGGAAPRLYRQPSKVIVANELDEVVPALDRIRSGLQAGKHAAGYLAYEAGHALDPKLVPSFRKPGGPLLCFGLFDGFETPVISALLPSPDSAFVGLPSPRISRAQYEAAVSAVHDHLLAGDFYQANLTFGCDVAVAGDPIAIYSRLRRSSQAGWGGVVLHDDRAVISLSPEQFFTLGRGVVEARPMKGTAPRRSVDVADRAEAAELASDEKQRAENLMIVDLMRNDLARISIPGSVEVPDLFAVETYPTVHQMVSRITATIRSECDAIDILRTIFPCGSVTGAPKIAAIVALRQLELEPRGAYTGSMGWIEPHRNGEAGDAAFNVLIRTLQWHRPSAKARLGLGSGLVVDSEPSNEWAECLLKGDFVRRESQDFDLIETMRFDPSEGIVDLDRHLDRMRNSSADLDFRFDRHAARNELQAATFGRKQRAMVRLLLSRSGAMAIQAKPYDDPADLPVRVAVRPLPVDPSDFRLRYKTTDRRFLDLARESEDAYETIFVDPDGQLTEGSRTSIFVERDGKLLTPPLSRGLMPGILRAKLIEEGKAQEAELTPADLDEGFYIGNVIRGLIPARIA
ncbi:aminodeoxychorismate synthase component I [Sphingomonas sp. NSE70-1]|uniref:Probable branched-chain-amino-acid aminotransferase n=1 Tax=Sphingomonas caseinilyticus TaxID=2908205 RepID=A0ABT0RUE3_9SPHN|nr:aminodeoxychorismate synthase component I [Sphingomonas caseinilyticus]MCL6698519.1 aminodeoxychorismate synthase component I [Sphingomonas caseinilyticus]